MLVAIWLVAGFVVTNPITRAWSTDYFPPTRLLQFIVGVALGLALADGWRPKVSMRLAIAAFVCYHVGLVGWFRLVPDSSPWGAYSASQLFALPVYLLIVLAGASNDLGGRTGLLGHSWLIRLGHWSFAWYLVHEIVLRAVVAWGGRPHGALRTLEVWLVVIVLSQGLAGVLYTIVEHPAERWLRSLGRQFRGEAAGPEAEPALGLPSEEGWPPGL